MPNLLKSITLPRQMFRNRQGVLRNIYAETRILLDIQAAVKAVIPGDIHVSALKDGELHLVTQSAAVATRVKYSQNSLIAALKAERRTKKVTSIKVSVRPFYGFDDKPGQPERQAIAPNAENGRQLKSAAAHIDDPDLKSALLKLSERAPTE